MFDPINLDNLSNDPKDLKVVSEVLAHLSVYAACRSRIIEARRQGHISAALSFERNAHSIYLSLPEWAKW